MRLQPGQIVRRDGQVEGPQRRVAVKEPVCRRGLVGGSGVAGGVATCGSAAARVGAILAVDVDGAPAAGAEAQRQQQRLSRFMKRIWLGTTTTSSDMFT